MENLSRIKPLGQPPKIWKSIEKVNKDGTIMKFTIQEIPEDRYEDAFQHMCTYFLADEPICQCLNVKDDSLLLQDMNVIWHLFLEQGLSIAAFVDNPTGKPIIAGMNVLSVAFKDHKDSISQYQFKSQNCNTIIGKCDTTITYDYYGVDKYLYALGLSVLPIYRGYGLGKDILKTRDLIGREYNIPVTATAFTSIPSQKSARSVGFELLTTKNFVDMVDENGKQYFPGIKSKTLEIMGKRFS